MLVTCRTNSYICWVSIALHVNTVVMKVMVVWDWHLGDEKKKIMDEFIDSKLVRK